MIPPRGFKAELYPLRHKLLYSAGLSATTPTQNSVFLTLIRHTNDVIAGTPGSIVVNPHHGSYVTDAGAAVAKMSIIDNLNLSLKFNMTEHCNEKALTGGTAGPNFDDGVYTGDGINAVRLTWRPVFFSFPEKLDAADDSTTTTVAAILGLTKVAGQEDVVPLTTDKLPITGGSDLLQPLSTVNIVEVAVDDYNMTTGAVMEDHPWDETLFQEALRRYTNKGALAACVGRTRHLTLTRTRPYKNYYISKFVPRSIRRVMPYTFMGIQVNVEDIDSIGQIYHASNLTGNVAHVGLKAVCTYHEWNADHYQEMSGTPP